MLEIAIHACIACYSLGLFYLARRRLPRRLLLIDTFYASLAMFAIGAWIASPNRLDGDSVSQVFTLATLAWLSGSVATTFAHRIIGPERPIGRQRWTLNLRLIYPLTAIFVVLSGLFSYFVFVVLLGGSITALTTDSQLMVARKIISSGEQGYYYPGLIKQARDILGPAFLFVVVASSPPGRNRKLIAIVTSAFAVAMFFSGQRMPLLILAAAGFAGHLFRQRWSGARAAKSASGWVRLIPLAIASIFVVGLINQLLGRAPSNESMPGVTGTTEGLLSRLIVAVPEGNIQGFRFLTAMDFSVGELWLSDVVALIPGTDFGLSNRFHAFLGGSDEGNAVLGLPVSAYLNAGYIGVVLTPLVAILGLSYIERLSTEVDKPWLHGARYALLGSLLVCYDFAMFLLNGGLFFFAVLAWYRYAPSLVRSRRTRAWVSHSGPSAWPTPVHDHDVLRDNGS